MSRYVPLWAFPIHCIECHEFFSIAIRAGYNYPWSINVQEEKPIPRPYPGMQSMQYQRYEARSFSKTRILTSVQHDPCLPNTQALPLLKRGMARPRGLGAALFLCAVVLSVNADGPVTGSGSGSGSPGGIQCQQQCIAWLDEPAFLSDHTVFGEVSMLDTCPEGANKCISLYYDNVDTSSRSLRDSQPFTASSCYQPSAQWVSATSLSSCCVVRLVAEVCSVCYVL